MTKEMKEFQSGLMSIKVKNVVKAYDYVGNEINGMSMDGNYDIEMSIESRKNIEKEFKVLKKFYKGKIDIILNDLVNRYHKGTNEYFFLNSLITIMNNNQ